MGEQMNQEGVEKRDDVSGSGTDTPAVGDTGRGTGEDTGMQEESVDGEKEGKGKRGKGKKGDSEPAIPLGALRVSDGTEVVKVGPDDWRPVIRLDPAIPDTGEERGVRIQHEGLEGQKIMLGDGTVAVFDQEGIIEVSGREAKRLLTIPGYKRV